MTYVVALTGSIASGKSTALAFFKAQGIEVIDADQIARELTQKNTAPLANIIAHFGADFLQQDGSLDRQKLRACIIDNPHEKRWLEELLHPLIRQHIELQLSKINSPYAMIDIPLLTDKSHYPYIDNVLLITTGKQQQIQRLMKRDQCSEKDALKMLTIQPRDAVRLNLANDVIHNNESQHHFISKLVHLHEKYLKISTSSKNIEK